METPYEELGPTRSLQPTVVPLRKSAPPAVKRMILELGLRYRPAAADALEGYQAKIAALTADCADLPPNLLERAIADWVRTSPFLPKASDLIARCQGYVAPKLVGGLQALADRYNVSMSSEGIAKGLRWIVEGDELKLDRP
jgi:hypothetical protein